jgi:hypothetical protein
MPRPEGGHTVVMLTGSFCDTFARLIATHYWPVLMIFTARKSSRGPAMTRVQDLSCTKKAAPGARSDARIRITAEIFAPGADCSIIASFVQHASEISL